LTLGHIFAKPKDPVKTNQKTHAVYSIPCGDCEKEYLCYTKHEIAWENSKVITTNNRYGQRLCLEAWHINMSNHALNRVDGAYLPEEYMHLIGR
jgi:hypothetical protein